MRTKVYTCQHEGCTAEAEEWCIDGYDPVPTFVYCHEHAAEFGFCLWCGHFIGGTEDVFLTGQVGMCFECVIRMWMSGIASEAMKIRTDISEVPANYRSES
jgi:hypothetical protein